MKQKSYLIKVDADVWEKFRQITSRNVTMHDAIVNLIEKEVKKNGHKIKAKP